MWSKKFLILPIYLWWVWIQLTFTETHGLYNTAEPVQEEPVQVIGSGSGSKSGLADYMVYMKEKTGPISEKIRLKNFVDQNERRNEMKKSLQKLAHQSQAPLLSFLETYRKKIDGADTNPRNKSHFRYVSLWITNTIALYNADQFLVNHILHNFDQHVEKIETQAIYHIQPVQFSNSTVEDHKSKSFLWNKEAVDFYNLVLIENELENLESMNISILDTGWTSHSDVNVTKAMYTSSFATWVDGHGHGTHVVGTAAGIFHGIASGCKVYPVKVLDNKGSGSSGNLVEGFQLVYWAQVISCSWGGPTYDDAIATAVSNAQSLGIWVVAAAGNNGWPSFSYPAVLANVISVAAIAQVPTAEKWEIAKYSSCSEIYRPITSAPGTGITSCRIGGGSTIMSGTSMATPLISGCLMLMKAAYPNMTLTQGFEALKAGATPITGPTAYAAGGMPVPPRIPFMGVNSTTCAGYKGMINVPLAIAYVRHLQNGSR